MTTWTPLVIDRRGSMTLPADLKRQHGFGPDTVFLSRVLDNMVVLVPFDRFARANPMPATDHQKDAVMAMALTDALQGKNTVSVPLLPVQQAPVAAIGWPDSESQPVDEHKHLVYMNKKGFIPTPDAVKEALGLGVGDSFTVEIRNVDGMPVIQLEPLKSKHALDAYTARRRQQDDEERLRKRDVERAEVRLRELQEQIDTLNRTRELLDNEVRKKRASAQGTSLFSQLLNGNATVKEEKTIASVPAAGNPVPDHMNSHKPPTEALPPGMKWHFGGFGWVKVDDIDYVEPETEQ